jgi:hypothetical protein
MALKRSTTPRRGNTNQTVLLARTAEPGDHRAYRVDQRHAARHAHDRCLPVQSRSDSAPRGGGGLVGPNHDGPLRVAQLPWPPDPGKAEHSVLARATETTVSPHVSPIALPILPQQAHVNLEALRTCYPGIYTTDGGFYASTQAPARSAIGASSLDQSMILAALDNALNGNTLQRYFANDPVSWAARLYLGYERISIG